MWDSMESDSLDDISQLPTRIIHNPVVPSHPSVEICHNLADISQPPIEVVQNSADISHPPIEVIRNKDNNNVQMNLSESENFSADSVEELCDIDLGTGVLSREPVMNIDNNLDAMMHNDEYIDIEGVRLNDTTLCSDQAGNSCMNNTKMECEIPASGENDEHKCKEDQNGCESNGACIAPSETPLPTGQGASVDNPEKCNSDVSMVTNGCQEDEDVIMLSVTSLVPPEQPGDAELGCSNASSQTDLSMDCGDVVGENSNKSRNSVSSQTSKDSLDACEIPENNKSHQKWQDSKSLSNDDVFATEVRESTRMHGFEHNNEPLEVDFPVMKNKFTYPDHRSSETNQGKTSENYHHRCFSPKESGIPRLPTGRKHSRCASVTSDVSDICSIDSLNMSVKLESPDVRPDWIIVEKDLAKLTKAQKKALAKREFAATHYMYGIKPDSDTVRSRDLERCTSLRSLIDTRSDVEPVQRTPFLKRSFSLRKPRPLLRRQTLTEETLNTPAAILKTQGTTLKTPEENMTGSDANIAKISQANRNSTEAASVTKIKMDFNSPAVKQRRSDKLVKSESTETPVLYQLEENPYGVSLPYITPLQHKEKQAKELSKKVKDLEDLLQRKDAKIAGMKEELQIEVEKRLMEKEKEMDNWREEIEKKMNEMREEQEKTVHELKDEIKKMEEEKNNEICQRMKTEKTLSDNMKMAENLESTVKNLEAEFKENEQLHQERYLEMYKKGQLAQEMEMEEDMVLEAAKNPRKNKTVKDLLRKLEKTEAELEKVKESRRKEIYEEAPHIKSDPEARVELLRSSFYYYLIGREVKTNLRAILSILDYTEVQKQMIINSLKKKKNDH